MVGEKLYRISFWTIKYQSISDFSPITKLFPVNIFVISRVILQPPEFPKVLSKLQWEILLA